MTNNEKTRIEKAMKRKQAATVPTLLLPALALNFDCRMDGYHVKSPANWQCIAIYNITNPTHEEILDFVIRKFPEYAPLRDRFMVEPIFGGFKVVYIPF